MWTHNSLFLHLFIRPCKGFWVTVAYGIYFRETREQKSNIEKDDVEEQGTCYFYFFGIWLYTRNKAKRSHSLLIKYYISFKHNKGTMYNYNIGSILFHLRIAC